MPEMPKSFEYEKVSLEFLNDLSKCGFVRAEMPVSAATMFEALKGPEVWKAMLPVDIVEWHGPPGPDTSRTIAAKGSGVLEQFFEWEEGRMFAFRLERGSVGILKAMAERYEVAPLTDNSCEIILTYRIQAKGLAAPFSGLIMGLFRIAGRQSMKKLAAHMANQT